MQISRTQTPSAIIRQPVEGFDQNSGELPTGSQLCWPTLETIKQLGGSATVQEIGEKVPNLMELSEAQQAVMRPDGVTTELYHRLSAARTYLKGAGAIERSARGVWAITELGRGMTDVDMQGITTHYQVLRKKRREEEALEEAPENESYVPRSTTTSTPTLPPLQRETKLGERSWWEPCSN
jgi:restriction system protein